MPAKKILTKDAVRAEHSLTHMHGNTSVVQHKKRCKICRHERSEEIDKILRFPMVSLDDFCTEFGFDKYSIKDCIVNHSKVTGLDLEQRKIAHWTNYFTDWAMSETGATVSNKLTFNDQQQKREGTYKEQADAPNVAVFQQVAGILSQDIKEIPPPTVTEENKPEHT